MKTPFQVYSAAATVVSTLVRQAVEAHYWSPEERASVLPPITPRLVEQIAFVGAIDTEIADRFLIDEAEVRAQFRDILRRTRAVRRINIRSLQFEVAKKLNGPMLIWIGRNELGQSLNPTDALVPEPEIQE